MRLVASNLLFNFELLKAIPSSIVCIHFVVGLILPYTYTILSYSVGRIPRYNKWTTKNLYSSLLIGMHNISCVNLNVVSRIFVRVARCLHYSEKRLLMMTEFYFSWFINSKRHCKYNDLKNTWLQIFILYKTKVCKIHSTDKTFRQNAKKIAKHHSHFIWISENVLFVWNGNNKFINAFIASHVDCYW